MKILFAGTPDFAIPSLEILNDHFPIVAVLTQPTAGKGRGQKLVDSPIKKKALALGLKVFESEELNSAFLNEIKELAADLLVCVAYGKIFKNDFLNLFPYGGINLHPSLLPRHRGPAPIPAAILAGDTETGVTIQRLILKMDAGPILAQQKITISDNDTTGSLSPRLARMGALLLPTVIAKLKTGQLSEIPQDDNLATYCKLLKKTDGELSFKESALTISRMIRAYQPWPQVYSFWKGKRLFFLEGRPYPHKPSDSTKPAGLVLGIDKESGILINTCQGVLSVSRLQLEFKKPLFWRDFLNGHKDFIGSICGGQV